ncbi:hypothetical protein [Burkholderia glumae]|uniref:hypothetical protein n=1 Tax=Burkholderia glumae TaxID=337 RepID=UPI0020367339|nr:hypothetical protein [Burkholderia glumae]MCM2494082.1 hypothetical protein [Burkholderia glumae]MCM2545033.1 hypothetical protein [Burkholderia glumae]
MLWVIAILFIRSSKKNRAGGRRGRGGIVCRRARRAGGARRIRIDAAPAGWNGPVRLVFKQIPCPFAGVRAARRREAMRGGPPDPCAGHAWRGSARNRKNPRRRGAARMADAASRRRAGGGRLAGRVDTPARRVRL